MTGRVFLQGVAATVQKLPWLITSMRWLWRSRQARFSVGAVGVVFDTNRCVLLVKHVFHPHTPWGLPGGWVERNEAPADTIRRELMEELGLTVEIGQPVLIEVSYTDHLDVAYLCHCTSEVGTLSNELLDYSWVALPDLPPLQTFHQRAIERAMEFLETTQPWL